MDATGSSEAVASSAPSSPPLSRTSSIASSLAAETIFSRFLYVVLVSKSGARVVLNGNENEPLTPLTGYSFPNAETDDPLAKAVAAFCFPESIVTHTTVAQHVGSFYAFVMTEASGARMYGYCLRRLPKKVEHARERFAECICFTSYHPWFELFSNLLTAVDLRLSAIERDRANESRDRTVEAREDLRVFLQAVLTYPFPSPGERIRLVLPAEKDRLGLPVPDNLVRPGEQEGVLEHVDYSALFSCFDETAILRTFAAILCERRVLFISSSLSRLSSCVHAAIHLVHPFTWQHVFIPILPKSLIDYVLAPMPYVIGVDRSHTAELERAASSMSEVVFVDIDRGECEWQEDLQLFPNSLVNRLRSDIREFLPKGAQRNDPTLADRRKLVSTSNAAISEAFFTFLVTIFGRYHLHFDANFKFKFEEFRDNQPQNIRQFLDTFAGSQMYEQFIVSRSARLRQGLDIDFKTVVPPDSAYSRFNKIRHRGQTAMDSFRKRTLRSGSTLFQSPSMGSSNLADAIFGSFGASPSSQAHKRAASAAGPRQQHAVDDERHTGFAPLSQGDDDELPISKPRPLGANNSDPDPPATSRSTDLLGRRDLEADTGHAEGTDGRAGHARSHSVDVRAKPVARMQALDQTMSPATGAQPLPQPLPPPPSSTAQRRATRSEAPSPNEPIRLAPPPSSMMGASGTSGGSTARQLLLDLSEPDASTSTANVGAPATGSGATTLADLDLELAFGSTSLRAAGPGASGPTAASASLIDFGTTSAHSQAQKNKVMEGFAWGAPGAPPGVAPAISSAGAPSAAFGSPYGAPMRPPPPSQQFASPVTPGLRAPYTAGWGSGPSSSAAAARPSSSSSSAKPASAAGWSASTLSPAAAAGASPARPKTAAGPDPFASLAGSSWTKPPGT